MTFGQKLQALRKKQGWSQEGLAERMTVSRQAVSKWELDESTPDTENILRLSGLFGVTTDFLLKEDYQDAVDPSAYLHWAFILGCILMGFGIFSVCGLPKIWHNKKAMRIRQICANK